MPEVTQPREPLERRCMQFLPFCCSHKTLRSVCALIPRLHPEEMPQCLRVFLSWRGAHVLQSFILEVMLADPNAEPSLHSQARGEAVQ